MRGIESYGTYIPRHRIPLADIGSTLNVKGGSGSRVAASFDEDSTTMGVAAASIALGNRVVSSLYFATTSPSYSDKTNATAIHAALGLPDDVFSSDLAGSARGAIAALRMAAASNGLAVFADVRVGLPGSSDERDGGDGAAAFVFGENPIAEILAEASETAEFLDRWRDPMSLTGAQWEERFGLEAYLPVIKRTVGKALSLANLDQADHVVLVSPNFGVSRQSGKVVAGKLTSTRSPIGHCGTADFGLALARVLDHAAPGETVLAVSAADGCDAIVLRATERIRETRQPVSVVDQLSAGTDIPYATYLTWRGLLDREPPRRPEPDRVAAPPSARSVSWKFAFTGSQCRKCSFVHLPPARVCKRCKAIDEMDDIPMARSGGRIATYTVDRLAFSLAPPVVSAVVDFDGGGRYMLEVADGGVDRLEVGARVEPTFRRLHSAGGVHNYFWKVRLL